MQRWPAIVAVDDPQSAPLVKDALVAEAYDVVAVAPPDVLAAASTFKSALVIVGPPADPQGPGALAQLRERSDGYHIVAVLPSGEPAAVTAAYASGVDAVMVEPIVPAEVHAGLRLAKRLLALEELHRTLEDEGALLAEISSSARFHSRRYLQSELANELTRARRFAHALAVIVAQARHLEGGERAMRSFGRALSTLCRSRVDWIARHGERSYAVVLPETDLAGALRAAGRLQAQLKAREATDLPESIAINLGVSAVQRDTAGFAETASPQRLIEAAEHYLVDAERLGPGHIAGGLVPHA
jgi:diguanylate cyclase (GGDEF)-like protein